MKVGEKIAAYAGSFRFAVLNIVIVARHINVANRTRGTTFVLHTIILRINYYRYHVYVNSTTLNSIS